MASLPQVAAAFHSVLVDAAEEAARTSGWLRRQRKLSGAAFVQALVLGWLADPRATLAQLAQAAAARGVAISPQGLAKRFTPEAAACLRAVLEAAVARVVAGEAAAVPLLGRFAAVVLLDSTTVALPDALATVWAGCGGRVARGAQAALKLTVRLDLRGGRLEGPELAPGRAQDKAAPLASAPLPRGALRIADLGYWSLAGLRRLGEGGAWWLSRLHPQPHVYAPDGARLDLPAWLAAQGPGPVDRPVLLGAAERLPARLLAAPVPEAVAAERRRKRRAAAKREGKTPSARALARADWTLLVTNAPAELLAPAEAAALYRARWQVERLFKLWKSDGAQLEARRSAQPWRVLTEVYAKLVGLVLQHWLLLAGCWDRAARSPVRAAQTVRAHAMHLLAALATRPRLRAALAVVAACLRACCPVARRAQAPATFQQLLDPAGALS